MREITVDTDDLKRALDRVGDELLAGLAEAIKESAQAVRQDARWFVPVDTGNLRDAITIRKKSDKRSEVYIDTSDVHYGHIVEFGSSDRPENPFMGPAAARERGQFKARVVAEVKKVADG